MMPARKVLLVQLARDVQLNSDGTISPIYIDLDPDTDIERMGPYVQQIVPHVITRGATTNHKWNVVFRYSGEGRSWSNPIDLFTPIVAGSGYAIQAAYTTTTNFGLRMKYALRVENSSAGTIQSANVSAWVALHFWS
jgi:hypothetical protein